MEQQQWMYLLESEGYRNLQVPILDADVDFGVHTHSYPSVHVILEGSLLITELNGSSRTLKAGDRFEIAGGTTHSAKTGPQGCTMIVGERG